MTQRLVARLIVALALVVPIAASAQSFVPKAKSPDVPSNLFLTFSQTSVGPARLKYVSGNTTFSAQADAMKANYEASGLVVEMSVGSFTGTDTGEPFQLKSQDTFKTLLLTFATNGTLTDVRLTKD